MSWDRRIDLHIDVDAPTQRRLLTSESEPSILNQPPEFVTGDKIKVRTYFWRRGATAGALDTIDPGSTSTFRLSGRPQGIPAGSPVLFLATSFTQVGTGIWETTLDLNTQEMRDHIAATPAGSKLITVEIEIRDAGDTTRRSLQFEARAMPQVWDNQDAPTSLPSPADWLLGSSAPTNGSAEATATGTITFASGVISGDNIWILWSNSEGASQSRIFTFRSSPTGPLDVSIGFGTGSTLAANFAMVASAALAGIPEAPTVAAAGSIVTLTAPVPGYREDEIAMLANFSNPASCVLSGDRLTGGADEVAPTSAPPYIRVAGGFLYIKDGSTWKKTALSNL